MASLKDVKIKIAGVRKTKQITKAMNMVASAKLRGAQIKIEHFRPYAEKFQDVISNLATRSDETVHTLLEERTNGTSCVFILITSDRGLCGIFNTMLIIKALELAKQKTTEGKKVSFICIGRKGRDAIKKTHYPILSDYSDRFTRDYQLASHISGKVIDGYLTVHMDEVILIYGQFINAMRQIVGLSTLLPIHPKPLDKEQLEKYSEYVYEPGVAILLSELLPKFVTIQIYRGFLDTDASENAARMTAMDNATRNCDELIGNLTRLYNKTRQASITSELIDIVNGAEALK